jgi:hypothetical protein
LKDKPALIASESLAKLLAHVEEPYRTMVQLIAGTGLRIGELLALRSGGMLICPTCGGSFEALTSPKSGGIYLCATRRRKPGVCSNTLTLPMASTDSAVLDMIEGEVLGGRLIDDLLTLVDTTPDPTAHQRAERDRLQREIDTLTRSVAKGMPATAIAPIVREYQAEIAALDVALSAPARERVNLTTLREALTQRTAQWKADLRSEPAVARLLLRRLVGPLTLWDASTPGADWCEWEASVTGTDLLDGLVHLVASPTGFEPVSWP